jgi:hypothetical protein
LAPRKTFACPWEAVWAQQCPHINSQDISLSRGGEQCVHTGGTHRAGQGAQSHSKPRAPEVLERAALFPFLPFLNTPRTKLSNCENSLRAGQRHLEQSRLCWEESVPQLAFICVQQRGVRLDGGSWEARAEGRGQGAQLAGSRAAAWPGGLVAGTRGAGRGWARGAPPGRRRFGQFGRAGPDRPV